jgi:hypothetical protein
MRARCGEDPRAGWKGSVIQAMKISRIHGKRLPVVAIGVAVVALVVFAVLLAGCSDGQSAGSGSAAVLSGAGAANTVTVSGNATVTSLPTKPSSF